MKFCEECGAQLEDDAIFCEECGATVESVESVQPEVAAPVTMQNVPENVLLEESENEQEKELNKKSKKLFTIVIAAVVIVLIGITVAVISIIKRNNKDDSIKLTDETKKDEVTTVDKTTEEETTTEENIVVEDLYSIYNGDFNNGYYSWDYTAELPNEVFFGISDDPTMYFASLSKPGYGEFSYYVPLEWPDEWIYGKEYSSYQKGTDINDKTYDNEVEVTVLENGIDIRWILNYPNSSKEFCNGFYGMEYIECISTCTKETDALKIVEPLIVEDYETDCFYKRIKNGKVHSVEYYTTYNPDIDITCSFEKNYLDNTQHIYLQKQGVGNIDFYPEESICYNKEAVFYLSGEDYNYCEELLYYYDENGNKQYDLTGYDCYFEIRFFFTEDNVDVYWSIYEDGVEYLISDVVFTEDNIVKRTNIKNY